MRGLPGRLGGYGYRMLRTLVASVIACLGLAAEPLRVRPATWAQPVLGSTVENWHVVDARVMRSGQPDRDGMRELERFGVRTVLNLRNHHDDEREARGTRLHLEHLPSDAGDLTYAQILGALRVLHSATAPVVVHCWHGSDRTGAVIAAWRIAAHGWTAEQALDEMVHGGYGHHDYYDNLRILIGSIDPQRLRRDAGIATAAIAAPGP